MSSNKSFSTETSARYAKALFEIAHEESELLNIEKNMQDLLELYNNNKEFQNFIKNPTQTIHNQQLAINKISEVMNFSKPLKNFLLLLVLKRRIFFLNKMILSFLKLSSIKRGEINAELTSSKTLTNEELKKINDELSKAINSKIKFNYKVDENLIGGFRVQLGSFMVDTSIKNRLRKIKEGMLEN
tara:strand:- start:853 stop:1410 length:558 start_codon:yes stop_codon:yes gene_type:complete